MLRSGKVPSGGEHTSIRDDVFIGLYEAHAGRITRYLRRCLGNEVAEDAAADVFARVLEKSPEAIRSVEHPLPWLYGIAVNVVKDHHRAERRRFKALERLASTEDGAQTDRHGEGLEPETAKALRKLAPIDRTTLLLVAWGELSYEETARALEVPVGTVRSRIARARKQLDDQLRITPTSVGSRATGGTHA